MVNYLEEIRKITNEFQSSFDFYILKNSYTLDYTAKKYLTDYIKVIKDTTINNEEKYNIIKELLKQKTKIISKCIKNIYSINKSLIPNFEKIDNDQNLLSRSKKLCEIIQKYFEDNSIRSKLSQQELYDLYYQYYQISSLIENNELTSEILKNIENIIIKINEQIWNNSLTPITKFETGNPFMFLVDDISKADLKRDVQDNVLLSLVNDDNLNLFNKYGFIYPYDPQIVDLKNDSFIIPQEIKKDLSNDKIQVNLKGELKPVGIYCITFGEREMSQNYVEARKLSRINNLPLIEIDTSLYRTKNNIGTVISDEEPLSKKEEILFTENFLMRYYKKKGYDSITIKKFLQNDIEMYKGIIIDMFLEQKKQNNIGQEQLFEKFEDKKNKIKESSKDYNLYMDKNIELLSTLSYFITVFNSCDDTKMKDRIIFQAKGIISRLKTMNQLIRQTSIIDFSSNSTIFKPNSVFEKTYGNYSPFKTKIIDFADEKIELIIGYKTKEEIEKDKQNMLKEIDKINEPIIKKIEHAKKVTEIKCNYFILNSLNNKIIDREKKNKMMNLLEKIGEGVTYYTNIDNRYDELVKAKEKLETKIKLFEENRKIYKGSKNVKFVEQKQKELSCRQVKYNGKIKESESILIPLKEKQEDLLKQRTKLDNKGFFGKMIFSKNIEQNTLDIQDIDIKIKELEEGILTIKKKKEYEEENVKKLENIFLTKYAPKGMNFENYKKRLNIIVKDVESMTSIEKQKQLQSKLFKIEKMLDIAKENLDDNKKTNLMLMDKEEQFNIEKIEGIAK